MAKKKMSKWPKAISYAQALELAQQACGTNVAFFPNRGTMVTIWHVHAEKIEEAMQRAYVIGRGGNAKKLRILPDSVGEVTWCVACHGTYYHLPDCPTLAR